MINYNFLQTASFKVSDHILYFQNKVVGILNPGAIFGQHKTNGKMFVYGVNGSKEILVTSEEDICVSLLSVNAILLGTADEAVMIAGLLNNERYSRTMSYIICVAKNCNHAIEIFNNLKKSTVTYIGSGGIGALSATIVAGMGVKKIRIVDHDIIEKSNLNRQIIWSLDDIGKPKVEILKYFLLKRFPDVEVEAIQEEISALSIEKFIKDTEVVLFTADNPIGMSENAGMLSKKYNFKLITTGYLLGHAGAGIWKGQQSNINWYRGPKPVIPSFGPTNMELAGLASSMIFHTIAGTIDDTKNNLSIFWDTTSFPRKFLEIPQTEDLLK